MPVSSCHQKIFATPGDALQQTPYPVHDHGILNDGSKKLYRLYAAGAAGVSRQVISPTQGHAKFTDFICSAAHRLCMVFSTPRISMKTSGGS
jgi:hypothetical protein